MSESKPMTTEAGLEGPPQFDRVADVLGPLEQIVLAADQELGTIQQQVVSRTGESAAEIERKVRESALEQRHRVAQLRGELTQRVTELASRFDALLSVLDEADRELAGWAGEPADVSVTVTERQRVQISHEVPPSEVPAAPPVATPPPVDGEAAKAAKRAEKQAARQAAKQAKAANSSSMADQSPILRGVRKLFGRSKGASA